MLSLPRTADTFSRPFLVFCLSTVEYAQVLKMLGNGRVEAQCFDGEKRLAHIRGKMRKKVSLLALVMVMVKTCAGRCRQSVKVTSVGEGNDLKSNGCDSESPLCCSG